MTPTKKQVRQCVRKWQRRLGLQGYRIRVDFQVDDKTAAAEASVSSEYRLAHLSFNLSQIDSEKELKRVVIHELMHVVLDPLATNAKTMAGPHSDVVVYLEESVVDFVERWPLWRDIP